MPETFAIDASLLDRKVKYWSAKLQSDFRFDVEMAKRDGSQARLSSPAAVAADSIEKFLGTVSAFRETLRLNNLPAEVSAHKEEFRDVFAQYAGAAAALGSLESVAEIPLPGKQTIDLTNGDVSAVEIVRRYLLGTAPSRSGAQLLGATKDLYGWVVREALQQKDHPKYAALVKQAESVAVKIGETTIAGFSCRKYAAAKSVALPEVSRDAYVGNEVFLDTLKGVMREALDYCVKERKNPNAADGPLRQTVTVWGPPGTGKSEGIKIVLNEAQKIAAAENTPFVIKELRGFKNEYYGKSEQNVRELFEEVHRGEAVYALVAEDIDTLFFAREELDKRPEDKGVLGELMNQLQGFKSGCQGNYVFIATSNHPLNGDSALMDRLRQCQIEVKGPQKPTEYVSVFQAKLRSGVQNGYVKIRDWMESALIAHQHGLVPRDLHNICAGVSANSKSYERPSGFGQQVSYAEKVSMLGKLRAIITDKDVKAATLAYVAGLRDQKGASHA